MLSGRTPFNGSNLASIAREIRQCNYTFDYPEFKSASNDSMDFIRCCLKVEAAQRLSMEQLLEHSWLKGEHSKAEHVSDEHKCNLTRNLQKFQQADQFQRGIVTFIIHNMEMSEEMKALGRLFRQMDVNGNGKLNSKELKRGLEQVFGLDSKCMEAEQVMATMDVDQDGRIDYTEFLAATISHDTVVSDKVLKQVFDTIDTDCSGDISLNELLVKLDASGISRRNELVWAEMIKNADSDNDKRVSKQEFCDIMKQFSAVDEGDNSTSTKTEANVDVTEGRINV